MVFYDRGIERKNLKQISYLRQAALVVNQIHETLYPLIQPGVTPAELDQVVAQVIAQHDAKPNFLGYYGYPANSCISVNQTVVHGIPQSQPLKAGDLVSFDCGCYLMRDGKQWHGDSAFSIIVPEKAQALPTPSIATADLGPITRDSSTAQQLNFLTREATWAGLAALASGKTVACVGEAVEEVVEWGADNFGWEAGIVEEFTGHGIGTAMHQPPDVLNYRAYGRQSTLRPGMVLCVEPILTRGSAEVITEADGWTVKTPDQQLACHWECQVALLKEGISVLNQVDYGLAGLQKYGIEPIRLEDL